MDRKNKISVTTMKPRRRNSSIPTSEERDRGFAINARDLVEFEALQMLARTSLVGMNPQEEAASLAVAEAEEAVAAAEVAVAAAEEAVWEAVSAETEAQTAVKTLCLMSIDYDWMLRASGAMVSHPEPKIDEAGMPV